MPAMAPPPQDSTENPVDDPEEEFVASGQITENENEKSQEVYTDFLSETQISIYPNPTKGLLTVATSDIRYPISDIRLYDIFGKMVGQSEIGQSEIVMDISHLPAGAYIMQIAVESEMTSWKIIKSEL
jgi:hypothetical protein